MTLWQGSTQRAPTLGYDGSAVSGWEGSCEAAEGTEYMAAAESCCTDGTDNAGHTQREV